MYKKNVLIVESGAIGGGSAESLYTHLKALKDEYDFKVIFLRKNRFSEKVENLNIKVFYYENTIKNEIFAQQHKIGVKIFNAFYKFIVYFMPFSSIIFERIVNYKIINFIKNIIESEKIDVIHTNNQPNRDFYAILAAKEKNISIISHIRTNNFFGFTKQKAKFCNTYVQEFITYILDKKETWVNQGIKSEKISIVNNALEVSTLEDIEILQDYKNQKIISLIGRIRPERGYEFFFEVIKKISNERQDFILLIVGNYEGFESYYTKLVKITDDLGIHKYVKFYGFTNTPHNIISESNIVVLPYTEVAFGRVVMESWQYKTPLIISKIKGIEHYITDQNNALLCDYGNINQWSSAISEIFDNEDTVEYLVENGKATYTQKYTLDVYRTNISKIYKKI